jgi:16S rRNA (cytosine1402-N4)-methyltransferase
LEEVLEYLRPQPGATIVDATVGLGGHSVRIAERLGNQGRLILIDQDTQSLELARQRLEAIEHGPRIDMVHANFADLELILAQLGIAKVNGVLADFGVSSPQFDQAERGFSFRQEGPLDMRMDRSRGEPAANLVGRLSAERLAKIFWEFGEERYSRRVAGRIVEERKQRPITTTSHLAEIVRSAIPKRPQKGRKPGPTIDPATKVFQALRIAVNDEMSALESFLGQLPRVVGTGGRAVLISFHSLEDRPVKEAFRNGAFWKVLTKKPVTASEQEVEINPRSRSAKLRAAERIA